ncbi:hypothetical protein CEG14_18800 [Bordetella genomosp. 1]|uniref:TadE-like domain-containing protein n=1 Tax=Bordetella genomosp. 1 TaxID=1395607 RepID=A0A261S7G5_9BORD|nr:TadE/TadG family type IV pilus assembly protein [Bordetella genomosp. 1]OZI32927.1 hypothetical protein CEG14_18800 [Bordetella genomosp. 1]OZI57035.1 hypothetical protein CAL27_22495 [Bordetella genomosp. 1]
MRPRLPASRLQRQRGVAAIEFALSITLLLLVLCGIVGLGSLFWAQQKITKAVGEGAQVALQTGLAGTFNGTAACNAARQEADWLAVSCAVTVANCPWADANGVVQRCARVSLSYNAADWPLLGMMRTLAGTLPGGNQWLPSTLSALASVQIPSGSTP